MRRRAWLRLLTFALLTTVAVVGWFMLTQEPDHPLGRRNYRRIVAGMTRAEVAAILEGPEDGWVGQAPEQHPFVALVEQEGPANAHGMLEGKPTVWCSERGQIVVMFDTWEKSARV